MRKNIRFILTLVAVSYHKKVKQNMCYFGCKVGIISRTCDTTRYVISVRIMTGIVVVVVMIKF